MKTTRENTKEQKEKMIIRFPMSKKGKGTEEKGENPAHDISINVSTLATAKKSHVEATEKVKEANLAVAMAGARPFKLYGNLLSDEARKTWAKVMNAQVMQAPWVDIFQPTY